MAVGWKTVCPVISQTRQVFRDVSAFWQALESTSAFAVYA